MHSKNKGNIAQSSVVLALQKQGLNVFVELGDLSRIDLIVEKDGILKKIQIKYCQEEKRSLGSIVLKLQKSGPNGYRYTYQATDIDWFAVYNPKTEKIAWIKAAEACENTSQFFLRTKPPKNKQSQGIRFFDDYDINGLLRDFTQGTVPSENGEDKVQTTTSKDGSGN